MPSLSRPLLFASLLLAPAVHAGEPAPTFDRVDFQAEVSRQLPNDLMIATVAVERQDKSPAALARALTGIGNAALQTAKAWPSVKVRTGNQRSWPLYGKDNKVTGWSGRAELQIESKDFKAAGELLGQLQDNLQLQGIQFTVSEETRQGLEKTLTEEAIAAFRSKADTVRSAWGAKGYRLVSLSIGSSGGQPMPRPEMMMMAKAAMADAAPAMEVSAGESRLSLTVSGSIQLDR